MKNLKNILITLSLLTGSRPMFAAQAPIPYPTQSATLSGMPTDLKRIITQLLTNFKNYDDAINAINALYQTDKKFRRLVENNSQALFNKIANNYVCISKEKIAKDLKISSIKRLLNSKEDNWLKASLAEHRKENFLFQRSPLGIALEIGDLDQVKKLVSEGHDFKYAGNLIGWKAACNPRINEKTIQVIEFLLQQGMAPECFVLAFVNHAVNAALYDNVKHLEIVKLLAKHGINVNSRRVDKDTALLSAVHYSAENNATTATVTFLLENGANPNLKDSKGKTALDWAEENRISDIIPVLRQYGAKHASELP